MSIRIPAIAIAAVLFVLNVSIQEARSEEVLFLSPTRIILDDNKKVAVSTVTNLSDIQRTYKVITENIVMTPAGVTTSVDDFKYSAKRYIRFVPREFTIGPGQRQAVRLMSRLPVDLPDGEYHCHIGFEEDVSRRGEIAPKNSDTSKEIRKHGQAGISAPISYSALIPIIISHGKVTTKVTASDFSIQGNAGVAKSYKISMKLKREGNGQGIALFEFVHVSPDGKTTPLGKRSTAHIYREIDERNYSYDLKLPDDLPLGGSVRISMYNDYAENAPVLQTQTLSIPQ